MEHLAVLLLLIYRFSASVAILVDLPEDVRSAIYSFEPSTLDHLLENSERHVLVRCNGSFGGRDLVTLKLSSADPAIAAVAGDRVLPCACESAPAFNASHFTIRGHFLGRTVIRVGTVNATQLVEGVPRTLLVNESLPVVDYHVAVIRKERFIDHLFLGLVSFMVICANIGMGCRIDLGVVKEVLTKPIAPAIGFGCQYIIMPLV